MNALRKKGIWFIAVVGFALTACGGGGTSSGGGTGAVVAEDIQGLYRGTTTLNVQTGSGASYSKSVDFTVNIASNDSIAIEFEGGAVGFGGFNSRFHFWVAAPLASVLADLGLSCTGEIKLDAIVDTYKSFLDLPGPDQRYPRAAFSGSFTSPGAVCNGSPTTVTSPSFHVSRS